MSVRVLLVDDHPFVRLGLRSFFDLVPDIEVVGEVGTAAGVGEAVAELEPDVVLMDLQLPDGDGTDVIATLHETRPGPAVVALTSFDAVDRIRAALRAGAIGYVVKDAGPDEVLAAVRAAARGEHHLDPALAVTLAEPAGPTPMSLTAREREVVALVGAGRSNQQIASALVISERTARTHVSNVLRKLGLSSRTQMALWATRGDR